MLENLCIKCKGKLLCGMSHCPILEKHNSQMKSSSFVKSNNFEGSSPPGVFVSWQNYPKVNLSSLASSLISKEIGFLKDSSLWFGSNISKIIKENSSLIRSYNKVSVDNAKDPNKYLSNLQEIAMSEKLVDLEIQLEKKPYFSVDFSNSSSPLGPQAPVKKIDITSSIKVNKTVDKVISDTDLKSKEGMNKLFEKDNSVDSIVKLLSTGLLGVQKNRKLVPTRWAITSADSNLSLNLVEEIKYYSQINSYYIFESHYLDNHFFILLCPSEWMFEQLEAWKPDTMWTQNSKETHIVSDHETYNGRKTYASNVVGAYYSGRLAVCEYLKKIKKQSCAIIFREIGKGYVYPVGVWQVRENVRHAFLTKPHEFENLNDAIKYLSTKLAIPINKWKKNSKILDILTNQTKLTKWF